MQLLSAEPERTFTLAELSRSLGISRATGHAILATLVRHQWVERHEQPTGYSCGPALGMMARAGGEFGAVLRELSDRIGTQVFLAQRDGSALLVTDSVGESRAAPPIAAGLRMPLAAPFGRDYVAWAGGPSIKAWLEGIGAPSPQLRRRLTAVLAQVRERGYVIERLSREYARVYTALRALAADGEPDPITARLAGAFADLTLVDYLPDELDSCAVHQIATVSAPIMDADGVVTMSITAAPFGSLGAHEIRAMGAEVRDLARQLGHALD
jgi:DNA-binding IclR family transcriptional regulator